MLRLFTFVKAGLFAESLAKPLEQSTPYFYKWAQEVIKHPSVRSIYKEDSIVQGAKNRIAKARA